MGSGGFGFSDELPQPDFAGRVRARDMWGFTESQETVHVSPAMYEEFVFPYEKPIMERFGLNCYGCCEPLHGRWHVVQRHPRLRRVSCSPWVNVEKMAGYPGRQVHPLAEAQSGRLGRARDRRRQAIRKWPARRPWKKPAAASWNSS